MCCMHAIGEAPGAEEREDAVVEREEGYCRATLRGYGRRRGWSGETERIL